MGRRIGRALLRLVAAVVVAVLALTVITFWRDRPYEGSGTTRVGEPGPLGEIPVRFPAGGLVPTNEWPDACRLVSEHDVKAVLPGATKIEARPLGVSTRTAEEFLADPRSHDDEYNLNGRCTYSMQLPGERPNSATVVHIAIIAVGDPDLIRRYHRDQGLGRGAGVGGSARPGVDECYLSDLYDAEQVCVRGPVMFAVSGSTSVLFRDFGGNSFWRDEVLGRFATSAGAKIRWAT